MARRRVVVTGFGALSPVGGTAEETWHNLVAGVSGAQAFSYSTDFSDYRFDSTPYPTHIAAPVKGFEPTRYMDPKPARRMARFSQLAVAAATMAVKDADLTIDRENSERIGVVLSNSIGSVAVAERNYRSLVERGWQRMHPLFMAMVLPNMVSANVSIVLGATGYNTTVVTACAGGTTAIGEATEAIRRGAADVILAGGADAPICEMTLAGMSLIGALSTRNDQPELASRPFDAERDGFVAAEGGVVLVLEELEHARGRGARAIAEVLGYGATCDAYHVTGPDPSGEASARAMRLALDDAGLPPEAIDHVNAHATSTLLGDKLETVAIKRTLGKHAYRIPISANKSMTGHMFAASGALEALASVLTIDQGLIPPTINYEHPDPECDLDYVPNKARQQSVGFVLSNSFGFGGQNACLVIGRPPEG
ncbi:MAG TPA: beta-ketoacyl-ACP synthase II [Chloroflexota bacterium]|nr:beta-ketoacyl-ACP synthase II [Chloroflexota bacterium]